MAVDIGQLEIRNTKRQQVLGGAAVAPAVEESMSHVLTVLRQNGIVASPPPESVTRVSAHIDGRNASGREIDVELPLDVFHELADDGSVVALLPGTATYLRLVPMEATDPTQDRQQLTFTVHIESRVYLGTFLGA